MFKNIFGSVLCQRRFRADIASILIVLAGIAFLVPVAKNIFYSDSIGYFRPSQYWASGDLSLAISGYWGPLSSWIMIPLGH